jgi:predicted nucleotidyltransferase
MSIRSLLGDRDDSALDYIPNETKNTIIRALQSGEAPTDQARLDAAVIASLRLNSPKESEQKLHDLGGGLHNRIRNASFFTDSILSLTELVKTKKYTTARIRRAIWYSYLGVTSSDVRDLPSYTRVLGMNASGCALLKRIKKASAFTVITKPSLTAGLSEQVTLAKAISDKADFVFQLSKPKTARGDLALISSPFVKK